MVRRPRQLSAPSVIVEGTEAEQLLEHLLLHRVLRVPLLSSAELDLGAPADAGVGQHARGEVISGGASRVLVEAE